MLKYFVPSFLAVGLLTSQFSSAASIQDFEGGTVSPGNTSLALVACAPDLSEGQYAIGSNAHSCHNAWSPTAAQAGSNFFIANGSTSVGNVYSQTVSVVANTTNTFSAWATGLYSADSAVLQLRIYDGNSTAGTLLNSVQFTTNAATPIIGGGLNPAAWEQFQVSTLTASSTITVQVFNTNVIAVGNDFGIDSLDVTQQNTPEPATFLLVGSALVGLMFLRRK